MKKLLMLLAAFFILSETTPVGLSSPSQAATETAQVSVLSPSLLTAGWEDGVLKRMA
jgi:hypothetical protein